MGYPVPNNAPRIVIAGRTLAVGAFDWSTPAGGFYKIGIYEQSANGEWLELSSAALYTNDGDCLKDMQVKGGGVKYLIWLKGVVNAMLAKLFTAQPVTPISEPTTEAQARAYISSAVGAWVITNGNGVPTVQ